VSSPEPARRSPGSRLTVAVVDAASGPGERVAEALGRQARRAGPIRRAVAIDAQRGGVRTVEWRLADASTPVVVTALEGVDALVWVATSTDLDAVLSRRPRERREETVRRVETLVTAAAAAGVRHVVVVTSAMVYGARRENPVPLDEGAAVRAVMDDGPVGDLLTVEQLLDDARHVHPGLTITTVRPAALVGPGIDTVVTRHFEAPRLLAVRGSNPAWQFCHVDDLASALITVVVEQLTPVVTVGCDGTLSQRAVEQLTGMRRIELSESVALGTAERLHRVGVLPTPASELAFALYPWAVPTTTLRAHGWHPAYDNGTCVGVLLEAIRGRHAVAARRVDRKDAALGAASAAVALVGTAAILRRARRK